jgi:hypothetical protein
MPAHYGRGRGTDGAGMALGAVSYRLSRVRAATIAPLQSDRLLFRLAALAG